ncbi:hypothetical protein HanIR_Chr09g0395631 [Helianthus annuus]|nr:hypothetical protein HanIR_Chr09g0395631 [Helianthus annuus]
MVDGDGEEGDGYGGRCLVISVIVCVVGRGCGVKQTSDDFVNVLKGQRRGNTEAESGCRRRGPARRSGCLVAVAMVKCK